jgi:hypothetical protein
MRLGRAAASRPGGVRDHGGGPAVADPVDDAWPGGPRIPGEVGLTGATTLGDHGDDHNDHVRSQTSDRCGAAGNHRLAATLAVAQSGRLVPARALSFTAERPWPSRAGSRRR